MSDQPVRGTAMAGGERDELRRWHLDRRVSVGHLLTTAVVGVSAILWLSNVENRVALNLRSIETNAQRIDRLEARQVAALAELKNEIRSGFTNMRTDLRALGVRIDRQSEPARSPRP